MKFKYLFIIVIAIVAHGAVVFADSGGILNGDHTTKVCHDSTCTTPTPGVLNFRPTGATAVVVDDVLGLSGDVWGNELGWINLNPTGEGVTITDASTGVLSGKAWSQVSGWINFAPTGEGVTIDPSTGEFSGWAWTGGPYGGWIKFNCTDSDTCIKTDWRGNVTTPPDSGGGGSSSSGSAPDVCPNILGSQSTLPQGYMIAGSGECLVFVDRCPNLAGAQATIPQGFSMVTSGACVPTFDYCPNIFGMQLEVPRGYTVSSGGLCIIRPIDACPDIAGIQESEFMCSKQDACANLDGLQKEVPTGYVQSDKICYQKAFDMCANIEGEQYFVPEGMTIDAQGVCSTAFTDYCDNLAGVQDKVPTGFYQKEEGICLLGVPKEPLGEDADQEEVVAFSFVPEALQFPVGDTILTFIVETLHLNSTDTFRVDLVSTILVVSVLLFMLHLAVRVVRSAFL